MNRNDPWLKKKFLKRTNSQGSFLLLFWTGGSCALRSKKKAADRCPNIFSISKIILVCQLRFVHNSLNLCFARIEIIQFVQHSVLKKRKTCVIILTTKKRSNSKEKSNHLWQKWKDSKTEISKARPPKTVRSNLCRLIKESKKDFKIWKIVKMRNHN